MKILFPAHPLNKREVDYSFAEEHDAAIKAGFKTDIAMINDSGIIDRSISDDIHLYRGWMLPPEAYKKLAKKIRMFTGGLSYQICHWLPSWYQFIIGHTPPSTHTAKEMAADVLEEILEEYGDSGFIIKGYVKSLKHRWDEAMFVPAHSTLEHAKKVLSEYLSDPDDSPGVVFRKYMPIEVTDGVKCEYRVFFLNGKRLVSGPYWAGLHPLAGVCLPDDVAELLESLAAKIPSPFFTMDVAKLQGGGWTIIEVGDGGVSGLQCIEPNAFYSMLKEALSE